MHFLFENHMELVFELKVLLIHLIYYCGKALKNWSAWLFVLAADLKSFYIMFAFLTILKLSFSLYSFNYIQVKLCLNLIFSKKLEKYYENKKENFILFLK
jgi:hypothetical protein